MNIKGIQATALYSESKPAKTSATPPPRLMPQPLGCISYRFPLIAI
jgi:hypothetical protein